MTDDEMLRLCAQAVGEMHLLGFDPVWHGPDCVIEWKQTRPGITNYDPLHDDAQAMALVKRFDVKLTKHGRHETWRVVSYSWTNEVLSVAVNADLNRAIVECCAKMQAAKVPA